MSSTSLQEPPPQRASSGSVQTLASRPLQPISDPSASKRVCFYKSGDHKFSGHRMIINARTFKTFDALLDALSKKVPLPFGVRTISTPRGIHLVKGLDDLHDGGSYVCSDRRRVKPLNLDAVRRRQVPWNTTRPLSAGRRGRYGPPIGRRNEVITRPAKVTERVAVRTPKRLVVIKNKDPTIKRKVVLQRRTAPTFDALLDYLSEIMQFPVLKLFSVDGRRVDGLAALILCSGVIVAAGNEPFRLGNHNFHRTGQMAQPIYSDTMEPSRLQPQAQKNKPFFSGRGSRNFSLSSERYIIHQINNSRSGSASSQLYHHNKSFHRGVNQHRTSIDMETCESVKVDSERLACMVPQDDDIEKSFRVNQDGSMTVEMKVRLTIKEEEMLHWTTTLSRSSLSQRTVCPSKSGSGNSSRDSNNTVAKDPCDISEDETKEDNHPTVTGKGVGFSDERVCDDYSPTALGKPKSSFKRAPTPGPRHVKKKSSVESVKMVTESGVQESTLGCYSYTERTPDGESHCVVRHSSSSKRPVPKPRKTASAGASNKGSCSSIRSSRVAEVLQIQNSGMEITETVMHIYESQGCYDNYFANPEHNTEGIPLHSSAPIPLSKPTSVDSGPHSSSNDCDVDFTRQPSAADSLQRQKEEILSLSSEPMSPPDEIRNNLSSFTDNAANSQIQSPHQETETPKKDKTVEKKTIKPTRKQKSPPSTNSSDKKQKDNVASLPKSSKRSSTDKLSNASLGKKSLSSSVSDKNGQRGRGTEKPQTRKKVSGTTPRKDQALLSNIENVKKPPSKKHINMKAPRDNGYNVNTPGTEMSRPSMKKNMSDILQPKRSLLPSKNVITKQKSMTENRTSSPKQTLELSESVSMPSLSLTPSDIHQYVENWLQKIDPDSVPYMEEAITEGSEPHTKVVFQIGGESESEAKSECQPNTDECHPLQGEAVKKSKSASCLSVPPCYEGPTTVVPHNEQKAKGLCVSMPSVRVDPVDQESRLRTDMSEATGPAGNESSSTSNLLSPKANIKPVLRKLCSSIQCIRRASESEKASGLEKSNSLPNFSSQVASVFGSSSKAFLSFLSVMTLRDTFTSSAAEETYDSRSTSEAMLLVESLQKISAIEDEEEQRASLTDLQSRTSSQLRERWKDFQVLRERLESEPLSPKFSEQEFALDVVSEGGDVFDDQHLAINELMEELSMPQDLREEISSMFQQSKSFYPEVEESTYVEKERDHSDSEEELEQFVKHHDNEIKQSPEPDATCMAEATAETSAKEDNENSIPTGEIDDFNEMQSVYHEKTKELEAGETERMEKTEEEEEAEEDKEIDDEYKEWDESKTEENEQEKQVEEVEEYRKVVRDSEDEGTKEVEENSEETEKREEEREEVEVEEEAAEEKEEEGEVEGGIDNKEGEEEEQEGEEWEPDDKGEELRGEMVVEEEDRNEEEVEESRDAGIMDEENEEVRGEDSVEEGDKVVEETDDDEGGEKDEKVEEVVEKEEEEEGEEVAKVTERNEEEEVEGSVEEKDEKREWNDEVVQETDEAAEEEAVEKNMEEEGWEGDSEGKEGEEELSEENEEEVDEAVEEKEEEEEVDRAFEEKDEEEDFEKVIEERDVEEECEEGVSEEKDEEEDIEKSEEDEANEEVSEDEDEEGETEEREEEEAEVAGGKATEDEMNAAEEEAAEITGDEGEVEAYDKDKTVNEREKWDESEESREGQEEEATGEEQETDERETVDLAEEERGKDEEKQADEGCDQLQEEESNDEENRCISGSFIGVADSIADGKVGKRLLEEASYLQQSSCEEDETNYKEANENTRGIENNVESSYKSSSEGQGGDDVGNGTDTVNEIKTDDGEEEVYEERSSSLPHPVEISQELLDFVNSALQSSSLRFTYDVRGNVRIEPDNARVVQTKQIIIPKSREDSLYGLKRLPSPSTSDLSDYRPETSESGGYKTQESVDIASESGEEPKTDDEKKRYQGHRHSRHATDMPNGKINVERTNSKPFLISKSEVSQSPRLKSGGSLSSYDSGTKASKEDLSYFSAASSLKADAEPVKEAAQCIASEIDSNDGVLIEQGRWLLKENHLIRKSPPISMGMYGNIDSTSVDTGQENSSEDSPPHSVAQHNPLVAISSSELEEMAKPQTPKCTYYNMSHGSESDPFLDDVSVKSVKKETSSMKGRGLRVSPTIDTSKTWAKKNGSLSSFASVEFKLADSRVHPEGESSAVVQARGPSNVGGNILRAQDSLDTLHGRCGQYCPIL